MTKLLLDPGMLQVPDHPSLDDALEFVERVTEWNKSARYDAVYRFLSEENYAQVWEHKRAPNQRNLAGLCAASEGVLSLDTLATGIFEFMAKTSDHAKSQDMVITAEQVSELIPEKITSRLTQEGIEGFLIGIVYYEIHGEDAWAVVSDIEAEVIEGSLNALVQEKTQTRNVAPMDFRAPIFNEPDDILRRTTIAEIIPGLDTHEGFHRGIRWAWLQLSDEQRRAHPNIERYTVTSDFLKGFRRISRGKPNVEWENHLRNTAHIIADIACSKQNCLNRFWNINLEYIAYRTIWRFRFNSRDRGHYRETGDGNLEFYIAGGHQLEGIADH